MTRPASAPAKPPVVGPRRRLAGEAREKAIVEAAVQFFAEVGFDGDTRELARRVGVTQSLIERVHQEVYVGRWNPCRAVIRADRRVPLEERLARLYGNCAKTALTWDWVRLFMFSGLKGEAINLRYLPFLRGRVLEPVASNCVPNWARRGHRTCRWVNWRSNGSGASMRAFSISASDAGSSLCRWRPIGTR